MNERGGANAERLRWRVHPAAERPGLAVAIGVLIAGLAVLAAFWMGNAYWGFFAALVLFLSLEAFFLPATFELDAEGVRVHKAFSAMTRPWSSFRRVVFDRVGVTLSPFGRRTWLEPYRAIRLRYRWEQAAPDPSIEAVRRFILDRVDREGVQVLGLPAGSAGRDAMDEDGSETHTE